MPRLVLFSTSTCHHVTFCRCIELFSGISAAQCQEDRKGGRERVVGRVARSKRRGRMRQAGWLLFRVKRWPWVSSVIRPSVRSLIMLRWLMSGGSLYPSGRWWQMGGFRPIFYNDELLFWLSTCPVIRINHLIRINYFRACAVQLHGLRS